MIRPYFIPALLLLALVNPGPISAQLNDGSDKILSTPAQSKSMEALSSSPPVLNRFQGVDQSGQLPPPSSKFEMGKKEPKPSDKKDDRDRDRHKGDRDRDRGDWDKNKGDRDRSDWKKPLRPKDKKRSDRRNRPHYDDYSEACYPPYCIVGNTLIEEQTAPATSPTPPAPKEPETYFQGGGEFERVQDSRPNPGAAGQASGARSEALKEYELKMKAWQ